MADGRLRAMRDMVVAQATFFGSSASADQVADFIDTGWLACTPSGGEPPPMPYDADALKALVKADDWGDEMAGRADIEAGRAYVSVYVKDSGLAKGLNAVGQKMQGLGAKIAGIGGGMTAFGAMLSVPFIGAIKAASDMEETMSKFGVVFGDAADGVKAWSDTLAGSVGRSKQQVASFMAGLQDLFVPLGFAAGQATDLSKQVTQLTFDLGSFNNMADEDVMRDMQAALTGSGEVMKKYGVVLSEAAVKQELLNQGLDPKTATDQMKVQARLNIIMRGTTAAQGDAIRTAGGFANQMKALYANVSDTAVVIGKELLPVVTPLLTQASAAITMIGKWVEGNGALVKTVFSVVAGITAAGAAFVAIGSVLALAGAALSGLATVFGVILSPIALVVAAIAGVTAAFFTLTDTGRWATGEMMGDFGEASETIRAMVGGISDALAAGDVGLAADIAMTGVKTAFFEATKSIRGWWIDMLKDLVSAITVAANKAAEIWAGVRIFLRDGITTNDTSRVDDIARRTRELKAKRSTMDPAEYRRQYEQLFAETNDTLEAEANRNNDIYQSADNAVAAIEQFGATTNEVLDAGVSGYDDEIRAMQNDLASLRFRAEDAASAARREREKAPDETVAGPGDAAATAAAVGKGDSAATFSASALSALGQGGGGPMQKLVTATEENTRIARRQLKAADDQTAELRRIEAAMTIA